MLPVTIAITFYHAAFPVSDPDHSLRILHLVSATAQSQQSLMSQLTPVVTRFNRNFLHMEVVYFEPGSTQATALRQMGVPVHEIEWSRRRFSLTALPALLKLIRRLEPDIIHAWGHSAQTTLHLLKRFMKTAPPVVWTMPNLPPIKPKSGFVDRQKLKIATVIDDFEGNASQSDSAVMACFSHHPLKRVHAPVVN